MIKFLVIALVTTVATPAVAQTVPTVTTAAAATITPAPVKPRRYCAENISNGTPYPGKVCMTRAQWIKLHGVDPLAL